MGDQGDTEDLGTDLRNNENPAFTGFFRDGKRRIDLVLVIQESSESAEKLKIQFITSAVEIGLELEFEEGVRAMHRHLTFVKVHAPDELIEEYGTYFDVRKFFKNSHVEFVKPDRNWMETLRPCLPMKNEKDWIKLVREQYPGPVNYSTIERSNIVYRMLLVLPFGLPENYFGLNRLLANNIILDAYTLHDGPYFYVPQQDVSKPNARQVLFHHWVGYRNLFKSHPVNLIREYYGERIAFFFSFYDFYNRALLIAAIFGILIFFAGLFSSAHDVVNKEATTKYTYEYPKWYTLWKTRTHSYQDWHREWYMFKYGNWYSYSRTYMHWFTTADYDKIHYPDLPVCPKCRDFNTCPFRGITEYATEVRFKNLLDNPYSIFYCFFISIWGIVFFLYWRKKEKYLLWMWEVDAEDPQNTIRPESRIHHMRSTFLGMSATFMKALFRLALNLGIVVGYVFITIPLMILYQYAVLRNTIGFDQDLGYLHNYIVLCTVAMLNGFLILLLDRVCIFLAYKLVGLVEHRTEDTYEKSLVVKLFGYTFLLNFTFIFFFAFIKGNFYTFPSDPNRWYMILGLGIMNCGLLSCIDELWLVFVFTNIAKKSFTEAASTVSKLLSTTDYSQWKCTATDDVPSWEREYALRPLNENYFMDRYRRIMLQFAMTTCFAAVLPLGPLIVLFVNIYDIRHIAEEILLHCRRPVMLKSWALGSWELVLMGLPYIATITNAGTIALHSGMWDKHVHEQNFKHIRYFADYLLGFFNTSDYRYLRDGSNSPHALFEAYKYKVGGKYYEDFCMFPGKWNRVVESYEYVRVYDNSYSPIMTKWLVNWYQMGFFLVFVITIVVIGAFLFESIDEWPEDIEDTMEVEQEIKDYQIMKEVEKKQK